MLVLILPTSEGWKAEWASAGKKVTQIFNPRRGRGLNQGPSGWEEEILPLWQPPPPPPPPRMGWRLIFWELVFYMCRYMLRLVSPQHFDHVMTKSWSTQRNTIVNLLRLQRKRKSHWSRDNSWWCIPTVAPVQPVDVLLAWGGDLFHILAQLDSGFAV